MTVETVCPRCQEPVTGHLYGDDQTCWPCFSEAHGGTREIEEPLSTNGAGLHDAVSLDDLSKLLGLDAVGKPIQHVQVHGRGSKAHVTLHLNGGEEVVLDPLGACTSSAHKLMVELASQAGATPKLKQPGVLQVVKLIYLLAEHQEATEITDRAWEMGAEYLRAADAVGEVEMGDQASRWKAFCVLNHGVPAEGIGMILLDHTTGLRYVRTHWFVEYLRMRTAPGEPALMVSALERLGWRKAGSEGRIKATQPEFGATLQWAFLIVPDGWEARDGR